jgi:hypothetical protein
MWKMWNSTLEYSLQNKLLLLLLINCVPISNAFLDVVINDPPIGPHHLHRYELAIYMINGNLGHMFG